MPALPGNNDVHSRVLMAVNITLGVLASERRGNTYSSQDGYQHEERKRYGIDC